MPEEPRFLKPVDYLPRTRRKKESFYDEILREFIYSGVRCAEVKELGRKPLTIQTMLKTRIERRKENINVFTRNKKVYLERCTGPGGRTSNLDKDCSKQMVFDSESIMSDSRMKRTKPTANVINLLNTAIVKARCPICGELNAKNSRICGDCGYDFYANEQEYRESLLSMEKLEKELNGEN
jgi:ribosomal protein L32